MLQALNRAWNLRKKIWWVPFAAGLALFLLGAVITAIIVTRDHTAHWLCLGGFLGWYFYPLFACLLHAYEFRQKLLLGLSFGRTRRELLWGNFLYLLLETALYYAMIGLLYTLERHLGPQLYPWATLQEPVPPVWWYFLLLILAVPTLAVFWGSFLARFGRWTYVAVYLSWIFSMMFSGSLVNVDQPGSGPLDQAAVWLVAILRRTPPALAAALALGILAILLLLARQFCKGIRCK